MNIRIRLAVLADAQAVALLAGQLGYPTSPQVLQERLANLLDASDHVIYVAESAEAAESGDAPGGVLGWVHVFGASSLVTAPFAEIGGLVVEASCRGQGVGAALMQAAEAWASARGYARVRVRSNTIRTEAHRFYVGLGYDLEKTQRVFTKAVGDV